jgi:hypothetical protein
MYMTLLLQRGVYAMVMLGRKWLEVEREELEGGKVYDGGYSGGY